MEPEGLLPHSQVPATCPYPTPDRPSPRPHIPLSEDPSQYYPPSYAWVCHVVSYPQVSPPKPLYASLLLLPACLNVKGHILSSRIYVTTCWKCLKKFNADKQTNKQQTKTLLQQTTWSYEAHHDMYETTTATESQPTRRRKEFRIFLQPHSGTWNTTCFPVNLITKHLFISRARNFIWQLSFVTSHR